jgi:Ca-activated chloride channel family protein
LNYFDYAYPGPSSGAFAVHLNAAPSPFVKGHHVVRVAVQGKRIDAKDRKPVHLVYLVDTSGSMQAADKIGLAKKSLKLLTDTLKPGDTVALCTYAGSVREVLPPTGIEGRGRILAAIEDLTASGSTAMSSGIDLAYKLAERTLVQGHVNRVIVLSDGDANVGPTSHDEILQTIKRAKDKGITLSTIGFGSGNYKDVMMEQLANQGDGNYSYIDSESQARRVFSEQVSGLLEVIARDVKIQVEFDPNFVKEYRLIGYENRDVADKDFRNDKVDAGEIGAGHSVTAIYDVVLKSTASSPVTVRLRHKAPLGSDEATESVVSMAPGAIAPSFEAAPADLRFATAVMGFAEILRQSPHAKGFSLGDVEKLGRASAAGRGDQQEFLDIVRRASALAGGGSASVASVAK